MVTTSTRLRIGALALATALSACGDDAESGGTGGSQDAGPSGGGAPPTGGTPAGGAPGPAGGEGSGGQAGGAPAPGGEVGGTPAPGGGPPDWPEDSDAPWTPQTPAGVDDAVDGVPEVAPPECRDVFVGAVKGWVAAPGGAPVPRARAQLCVHLSPSDNLLCLQPGTAGEDGVFTIDVPELNRCITRAAMRVLLPDAGKATTYCPVAIDAMPSVLRLRDPYVLFQTRPATTLPPQGDATAVRDVVFEDGLVVEFVPEQWYSGGGIYEELSARRVPVESVGLCLPEGAAPFTGLYAFYPEGSVDGGGVFPVHLPNTDGLAPGAQVELSVLGGLDCLAPGGEPIPEATWQVVGTATVSADGTRIESDAGSGIPCTTWLGYRPL